MTIADELVKHGIFNSKSEARRMIGNKCVSVIPCICEDYDVPIFESDEGVKTFEIGGEKQIYQDGHVLLPNGSKMLARKWRVQDCHNLNLLSFREHLAYDTARNTFYSMLIPNENVGGEYYLWSDFDKTSGKPRRIYRENTYKAIITWDKSYGKKPWLVTDASMELELHSGDTVMIGKKTVVLK